LDKTEKVIPGACTYAELLKSESGVLRKMEPNEDKINQPSHYTRLPIEARKIIKMVLIEAYGPDAYKAFCFGNEIKYRLRAGFKDDPLDEIGKAMKYLEFREEA